jgi:hypothetical protein
MADQTITMQPTIDLPNATYDILFATPGSHTWVAPADVEADSVTVLVVGAAGVGPTGSGLGSAIGATIPCTSGETFTIEVGDTSGNGYAPGGNAGGGSGDPGGAGGGATSISGSSGLLVVAGGGGGAGGTGVGGSGGTGGNGGIPEGSYETSGQPGANSALTVYTGQGGTEATASASGTGGAPGAPGSFGGWGSGGTGSDGDSPSAGGGAGGAGWFSGGGGGGGGGGYKSGGGGGGGTGWSGGGGGGGGTSYVDASVISSAESAPVGTEGYVLISWTVTDPTVAAHVDNFYMGNGTPGTAYSSDNGHRDFASRLASSTPGDYPFSPVGTQTPRTLGVFYGALESLPAGTQIRGLQLTSEMVSVNQGSGALSPPPAVTLSLLLESGEGADPPTGLYDVGIVAQDQITSQIGLASVMPFTMVAGSVSRTSWPSPGLTSPNPVVPYYLLASDVAKILALVTVSGGAPEIRLFSLPLTVYYNEAPSATVMVEHTDSLAPYVAWQYTDPEGDTQASFRVVVFTKTQVDAGGFNPNANGGWGAATGWGTGTTPVYDSGDVLSSAAGTWLPWVLTNSVNYRVFVFVSDIGSNGRYNQVANTGGSDGIGTIDSGVDFTTDAPTYTAPIIGSLPQPPVSFDPLAAAITVPVSYTPNGFSNGELVLQNSPDGVNWTTVPLADPNQVGETSITFTDYGYPAGDYGVPQTVHYRCFETGTLATGGPAQSPIATASITNTHSFAPTDWMLIDPAVPTSNLALQVKKATFQTDENQQVLMPVSRGRKVVIGDTAVFGDTITLDLLSVLSSSWDALWNQMQKVYPLLLRSPDGEMWYVRTTKRQRERVWQGSYKFPYRTYEVTFETVNPPPITAVTVTG